MRIKQVLLFAGILLGANSFAQENVGMDFLKVNSWSEVLAKAKAENKYIFVDAFTTWCGPCKVMAKNIFPKQEVGAFFNENFINVKVQLDTTENDNDHIRIWYQDAHDLMTKYKVNVFPTYLFLSPKGEIVHRAVGSSDAETFIAKGKDALIPEKQYYSLVRIYESGDRDPAFLKNLTMASLAAYDRANMDTYKKEYIATQKDLLTEENIKFLSGFSPSITDTTFKLMMKYPEKFDAVTGKGKTATTVRNTILSAEVFPVIFPRKAEGTKAVVPNWEKIESDLTKKYPSVANEVTLNAKIYYFQRNNNWKEFTSVVNEMLVKYPNSLDPQSLNSYAWSLFEGCDDMACVKQAALWSKKSVDMTNDPMYIDTYANLLHKTGKSDDAITWQKKAIEIMKKSGDDPSEYEVTLGKFINGEKTW